MAANEHIVAGGGWVEQETLRRPRTGALGLLAGTWSIVTFGASAPFWEGWPHPFGWTDGLCIALIAVQPVLVAIALGSLRRETPRLVREVVPNPDCDIRNLY